MIFSPFLHSKSRKKCHKNFENRFINKNLTPKNDFDQVFYMCKGVNPKLLILEFYQISDFVQAFWTSFKDLYSTAPKRGSVFIGLMNPDGAIWSRYQRAVLMR